MSKSVVVSGDTCKINQRDWNLIIESENETSVFKPRTENPSRLIINGFKGYISLQSLKWFSVHKTDIAILDVFGNLQTSIVSHGSENGSSLIRQVEIYKDAVQRLKYGKQLITHKIESQKTFIQNLSQFYSIDYPKYEKEVENEIKTRKTATMNDLLTLEGRTTQLYWKSIALSLKSENIEWYGRDSRDKNNRNADNFVNASLNYLYSLLQHAVRVSALSNGLSLKIGVLHDAYGSQEPLVYDLIEPLRYIADLTLIELISKKQITKSDFTFGPNFKLLIKLDARDRLVRQFNYILSRKIKINEQRFQVVNAIDRYVLSFKQSLLSGSKWQPLENLTLERNDTEKIRKKILSLSPVERKERGINKSTLWYQQQAIKRGKARKLYAPSIRKL